MTHDSFTAPPYFLDGQSADCRGLQIHWYEKAVASGVEPEAAARLVRAAAKLPEHVQACDFQGAHAWRDKALARVLTPEALECLREAAAGRDMPLELFLSLAVMGHATALLRVETPANDSLN